MATSAMFPSLPFAWITPPARLAPLRQVIAISCTVIPNSLPWIQNCDSSPVQILTAAVFHVAAVLHTSLNKKFVVSRYTRRILLWQ
jgi:hypothetical protein